MRSTKTILAIAAIFGVLIALNALFNRASDPAGQLTAISPAAGQEDVIVDVDQTFSLIGEDGEPVDFESFTEHKLLFFGFTHCPDICPAGMQKISRTLELLGDKAASVTPLLVTVDPERDSAEVMKEYTDMFDPRIIGLTGSEEAVNEVVAAYKAYASKSQVEGHMHGDGHGGHMAEPYMVDHSAYIYLLNGDNDVIDIYGSDESAAAMAEAVGKVLP